jgi:methylase of polypeptide subunit release factors
LVDNLIGGEEAVSLMEYLGLLFPCEMDTSIMVPYAHLFPIDVDVIEQLSDNESQNDDELDSKQSSIILVTDLHPKVLSRTTVGEGEDGAVMYIGPDSLALLQCLPLESHLDSLKGMSENDETFRVLDLCTGSGIQAISTLCALKLFKPDASAILVDVNDRALRFSRFNALLNNIGDDRISTVKTNLVNSQHDFLVHKTFDIILSNPPFIPTPDTSQVIEKRYGLFSSGGVDGEAVLLSVISMSKRLLKARGLVSIVSEFMNPPHKESDRELLDKIQNWWNLSVYENDDGQQSMRGIGILFTNEYPISASTYATRRADNESEFEMWSKHLEKCNIQNVSPGFLFLRTTQGSNLELSLQTKQVPKTKFGSIWTPSNIHAVRYVENEWNSKID